MNQTDPTHAETDKTSGFPLASIFFFVAMCAILMAMIGPTALAIQEDELDTMEVVITVISCGMLGIGLGIVVGLYHFRRWRGMLWGALTGLVTGCLIGPIVVSPNHEQTVGVCLGGSLLLVLIGALYRWQGAAN